jgi:hypothetical protein
MNSGKGLSASNVAGLYTNLKQLYELHNYSTHSTYERGGMKVFCKEGLTLYVCLMIFYVCLYECYKNLIILVSYIFKQKRMGTNYMHVVKMVPCGYAIQSMPKLFSSCVAHFVKSMNLTRMGFLFLLTTF